MPNLRTSRIQPNVPTKLLLGDITERRNFQRWDFPNGDGDRWWTGGPQPRHYQWTYIIEIEEQSHGSHLTREPFEYNAFDIHVGDYIASLAGTVQKITQVTYIDEQNVELVAEDYLRFNTFESTSGTGSISEGDCVIFEVNENIEPLLDGLPRGVVRDTFYSRVNSFFKYLNPVNNFLIFKEDHGFQEGDIVSISENGEFVLTNNENSNRLVGNVSHIMGDHYFMIRPSNDIFDYRPALPGKAGDFLYAYEDGSVTTEKTNKILFLKLIDAIPTEAIGREDNPEINSSDILKINDFSVSGDDLDDLVDNINNLDSDIIEADKSRSATEVISGQLSRSYGLVGGFVPFSFEINGNLVEVTDSTSGQDRYGMDVGDEFDIRDAINAAFIEGIEADVDDNDLIIRVLDGSAITLETIEPDTNGTPFAGDDSITGMPKETPESDDFRIRISRIDGGSLMFSNESGSLMEDLGLFSTRNGAYPTVLYIEQGIRKGDVYVVEDDDQRQALTVLPGDSAYVMDSGNGEWHYWLYSKNGWSLIATEDSARTDADVLSKELTFEDDGENVVGTVSNNSRVSNITVKVTEPFDGDAEINVGDSEVNDRLISENIVDLSEEGSYTFTPSHVYRPGNDTDLIAFLESENSTQGQCKVIITYS